MWAEDFFAGALQGAVGGTAGGFVGGSMNAWIGGASFADGLIAGLGGAAIGAVAGGLIGGTIKGIDAAVNGKANFWDGHVDLDLSKGYGATGIGKIMFSKLRAVYMGKSEGVSWYESASLGSLGSPEGVGGITLPEYGIAVGKGVYNSFGDYAVALKQHEFGHILQYRQLLANYGNVSDALNAYYNNIGIPSAFSASMEGATFGAWRHDYSSFEIEANQLSAGYFRQNYISMPSRFPVEYVPRYSLPNIDNGIKQYIINSCTLNF